MVLIISIAHGLSLEFAFLYQLIPSLHKHMSKYSRRQYSCCFCCKYSGPSIYHTSLYHGFRYTTVMIISPNKITHIMWVVYNAGTEAVHWNPHYIAGPLYLSLFLIWHVYVQIQTLVLRGMLLNSGHHIQFWHSWTRQKCCYCGHGRQAAARSHLHCWTYRYGQTSPRAFQCYSESITFNILYIKVQFLCQFFVCFLPWI
jgi:hypothetical protein